MREASGQAQGGPADASAGLTLLNDERGTWGWNPIYGAWMLLHTIVSGDTLWNLSGRYYGQRSMEGVHLIGNVEQNVPILGSDYRQAIAGDVILIPATPAMPPPGAAPPMPGPPSADPPPNGGGPVPQPGDPQLPEDPVGWLPEEPPPFWPPGMPWPPIQTDPEPDPEPPGAEPPVVVDPGLPPEPPPGPPEEPPPDVVLARVEPEAAPEKWWTTGRIALVGGLGLAAVGLIVWGATRGAKKRPRRRARPRRRQRRRR
jgi:hypothetical protein